MPIKSEIQPELFTLLDKLANIGRRIRVREEAANQRDQAEDPAAIVNDAASLSDCTGAEDG